jgi:signal transduction histidine kinase
MNTQPLPTTAPQPPPLADALRTVFGVLASRRTYTNLLYVLLSLPLALFYALLLGTGAALGAMLSLFGVGLLLLLGCMVAAWGFAMLERELAIHLLGVDIAPLSVPPTEVRSLWQHIGAHLRHATTWKSLAYLVIKLPFSIFTSTVVATSVASGLLLVLVPAMVGSRSGSALQLAAYAVSIVAGIALLLLSLHALNWIARAWGYVASGMLGIGDEERQLWEARQRAEAADRSRRDLILNVSHELRTPIASIQGHVDTLLLPEAERPADADPERYLRVVAGETRRLGTLVADLLDLARADADELKVTVREIEVAPVVRGVVAAAAPLARRDRRVTVAHADSLPALRALADPDRLAQVLSNLVRNAVNHTPEGGAVFLQLEADSAGRVVVEVADTGSGIAPEDIDRIFERFYRTDPSRARDSGGFGLGLPIARELAQAMGGEITVSSEMGVGSKFRVSLRGAA